MTVMLLDFDPEVTVIAAQPFWLRWRDDAGQPRRHAPDLFARMADGSAVVIDVRPDDQMSRGTRRRSRRPGGRAARQLAVHAGWRPGSGADRERQVALPVTGTSGAARRTRPVCC